jgi:hypothetical protein
MKTRIARQLLEFAFVRSVSDATGSAPESQSKPSRAALTALALLPLRWVFSGTEISSKIREFVYTLH